MAVISIIYEEGNSDTYECVELSYDNLKQEIKLNTGNFVKDWFDCMKFIFTADMKATEAISHSSTVNHFITDGAKYDSAYLHFDKDKNPYLAYLDRTLEYWFIVQKDIAGGYEFFVPENTKPTWEELKEMCK